MIMAGTYFSQFAVYHWRRVIGAQCFATTAQSTEFCVDRQHIALIDRSANVGELRFEIYAIELYNQFVLHSQLTISRYLHISCVFVTCALLLSGSFVVLL